MFECIQCGTVFDKDIKKTWGKTTESSGLGSRPVCVALVPDETLRDAKGNHPLQVCRGDLVASTRADAEPITLRAIGIE